MNWKDVEQGKDPETGLTTKEKLAIWAIAFAIGVTVILSVLKEAGSP